jgi:amidase
VIEINPDALSIAHRLDLERGLKGPRSPLHGIPVMVKDVIDTADQMMTTAGSLAMEGNFAPRDAFVVKRLREAGAILLGKTNMSEWNYMRSPRACSGWSSRGGQARNPYALDRSPMGSSSGSAVAVAANLCVAAVGAEVNGSIVRPAACNGVVGLKPTMGLLSRSGILGIAPPQDTAGPMARTVDDVAILLSVLAGPDRDDPLSLHGHRVPWSAGSVDRDPGALRGARLGVARDYFGFHPGTDAVIEAAMARLRELGAELVDPVTISTTPFLGEPELELLLYGMKTTINSYLQQHPGPGLRDLDDLIRFNQANSSQVMPFFGQEYLEQARRKGDLSDVAYLELQDACRQMGRREGIDRALRDHHLDAIIAPTEGSPAFLIDPIIGDDILRGGCATMPAVAGYPHLTVPAGYVHGLPVGLSFFAGAFQEARLLAYGAAFERATQVRRPPRFLPTISVEPRAHPAGGPTAPE